MPRQVYERADVLPALAEVFREHGFAGASLALISQKTGLGRGSLYHFFPGGKQEMASAVLAEIDGWFAQYVFAPLREARCPQEAIEGMLAAVEGYFQSGRRVCLVGAFALGDSRERFAAQVRTYFAVWVEALAGVLQAYLQDPSLARTTAEEAVGAVQGALVLARALDEPGVFTRALQRLRERLELPADPDG